MLDQGLDHGRRSTLRMSMSVDRLDRGGYLEPHLNARVVVQSPRQV